MLFANSFESEICQWAKLFYAIDAFPDAICSGCIEWIGGVGDNTSVPSEPQIDVCLAQLPKGEKNPLSARARSFSSREENGEDRCWSAALLRLDRFRRRGRPVITNLSAYRGRVSIDATSFRMVLWVWRPVVIMPFPEAAYLFGASRPISSVGHAIEQYCQEAI